MKALKSRCDLSGWKCSTLLFFVILGCAHFSQAQTRISDIETRVDLKDVSVFIDKTRAVTFREIEHQNFSPFQEYSTDTEAIHWYKFELAHETKAKYLTLYFWGSDFVEVHIPAASGYYKLTTGRIAKQQINFHRYEQSSITIAIASVDFSKPFYAAKHPISFWGKNNLKHPISVFLSMNQIYTEHLLLQDHKKSRYVSFLSIFFISFLLLLVTFLITKDRNYLNYSLYLLALILMFIGRVPFFYNLLNTIHPKLFFLLTQVMHVAAAGTYLYFVDCFVDFKRKSWKLYKLSRTTIWGIIIYGGIGFLLIIVFPFFPQRFNMVYVFEIVFTVISLYIFTRLLFKKPTLTEKIVLIGSQLLIIGNILTLVYNSNLFFLITAMAEIIAFSSALTVKNKRNEQKRLETKFNFEKERTEKQALLELSQLKSSFFTNISHEFRTPLSLIKGPLEDQLKKDNLGESEARNLKIAQKNTQRMERLVSELLALAKLESGKLKLNVQPGAIEDFLAAQIASFRFSATEKNIQLVSNIKPSKSITWFDRDALEKVISNLIGNAVKYTPEEGEIYLEAALKTNSYTISIKNSLAEGTNIEIDRIFDRFYQSSESNLGSGIGLALTKELVELHHGEIEAKLENDTFIQFNLAIPITESEFSENEQLASELRTNLDTSEVNQMDYIPNAKQDLDAAVLLIVDDNIDIRTYLTGLFENEYKIYTANNGRDGFKKAEAIIPDVIISDLKMPIEDGYALTEHCKSSELTFHIPIILLTAIDEDENRLKSAEIGVDAFISKPFSSSFLQATVSNLLQTRRKLQDRYSNELVLKTQEIAITSTEEQFLNKLQEVLDKSLTNSDFSTKQFSEAMHMSRMQLHRKLKALTGRSTSEFLRSQRLKAAAILIKQDKISISEVGYSVGFNDPSYFTKCFKQEFGVSPTQFAKKA